MTGRTAAGHCLENESFIKNLRYPRNQIGSELAASSLVVNVYSTKSFVQAAGKKTQWFHELSAMFATMSTCPSGYVRLNNIVQQLYWTNQPLNNWITDSLHGWGYTFGTIYLIQNI